MSQCGGSQLELPAPRRLHAGGGGAGPGGRPGGRHWRRHRWVPRWGGRLGRREGTGRGGGLVGVKAPTMDISLLSGYTWHVQWFFK